MVKGGEGEERKGRRKERTKTMTGEKEKKIMRKMRRQKAVDEIEIG